MWMTSSYTLDIRWATLCAASTFTITTTTIMDGAMMTKSQNKTIMGLLSTLIMHAGMAMKKITRFSTLFTVPMVFDASSLKMKSSCLNDISLTKNMKKVVDKQLRIG